MLSLDELPEPEDHLAVFEFVKAFNGYQYFGSAQAASQNARAGNRQTIEDLRNELFMYYRAADHQGGDYHESLAEFYRGLLPVFQRIIRQT